MSAKGAEDQYQIDAGQKRFGATRCSECGIVYQLGDPEDENAHLNYHNSFKTLKFNVRNFYLTFFKTCIPPKLSSPIFERSIETQYLTWDSMYRIHF